MLQEGSKSKRVLFEKVYGCLAGVAIGDAMGMPVASFTPEKIRSHFGFIDRFLDPPADHPFHSGLRRGQVTDDTELTMIIVNVILEDGKITPEGVARRLVQWAIDKNILETEVLGPSTSRALRELMAGGNPYVTGRYGTTNGAAMRISPVGLINIGDMERLLNDVEKACLPTHGTSVAISAASAVAGGVSEALCPSSTISSIVKTAKLAAKLGEKKGEQVAFPSIEKRIDLAIRLVKRENDPLKAAMILYEYMGTDVSAADSIPTAFGIFVASRGDPMTAILSAVNIGGDTDTIASIVGGIAGAFKGINSFPPEFVKEVEEVNRLNLASIAERLIEYVEGRE